MSRVRVAFIGLVAALAVMAGAEWMKTVQAQNVPGGLPVFKQYTITATATNLCDSTILDNAQVPQKLTVKNANGAANVVYLGSQVVANTPANAGIELAADQAYTFTRQAPCEIYIVGTSNAANIAFITAEY